MLKSDLFEAFAPTIDATTRLGYQLCQNQGPDTNIVISPFGILSMIAALHAGARGRTRQQLGQLLGQTQNGEIINVLGILSRELESRSKLTEKEIDFLNNLQDLRRTLQAEGVEQKEIDHEVFFTMIDNLQMMGLNGQEDLKFNLSVATSIWLQQSFPCRPAYLNQMQNKLGTHLEMVDFVNNPEQACDRINSWGKISSHGIIDMIISPDMVNALTRIILINTIYFSALWEETFNYPRPGQFHLFNGQVKDVQTISNSKEWRYVEGEAFQAVLIPYRYRPVSMTLILPKMPGKEALIEVEQTLEKEGFRHLLEQTEEYLVDITMPEFKINYKADLLGELSKLKDVIDEGNFSGISEVVGFGVDKVIQEATIEVDQHGTKAFAYSHGVLELGYVPKKVVLEINRPFLFLIIDEPTKTPLFMGRVVNPT